MSVNVSATQLRDVRFAHDVATILQVSGLPARLLTLELTESLLIEADHVGGILDDLRQMGVGISIDDFGTGYSSLSYLHRFPVTSVKIDRAFTSRLSEQADNALVRSILAIATTLDLHTVAEGVETDEQMRALEALDCSFAQGFLLARPQTPAQVDKLLAERTAPAGP